ncbi:MAG: anti-sigma factor [Sphingobacteriales bacterium]|nr:anti-sigma factor [Sphingobacteriales bacterium]
MNIQEYISGGIVESYVLGLASEEERREFEALCAQYPALLRARTEFELVLEKQALSATELPPAFVKEKLLNEIRAERKVIPLGNGSAQTHNRWKYIAAASVILLAGSMAWNISMVSKNASLSRNLFKAKENIMDLVAEIGRLQQNPNVKMASLRGMDISPQSTATVYWDTASHDVYLLANNLPAPPSDKQYQLWALLDGKPVDLGMMDYTVRQKKLLVRMKNAANAQAFAITLEKMDRADHSKPGGDMVVMGKL